MLWRMRPLSRRTIVVLWIIVLRLLKNTWKRSPSIETTSIVVPLIVVCRLHGILDDFYSSVLGALYYISASVAHVWCESFLVLHSSVLILLWEFVFLVLDGMDSVLLGHMLCNFVVVFRVRPINFMCLVLAEYGRIQDITHMCTMVYMFVFILFV